MLVVLGIVQDKGNKEPPSNVTPQIYFRHGLFTDVVSKIQCDFTADQVQCCSKQYFVEGMPLDYALKTGKDVYVRARCCVAFSEKYGLHLSPIKVRLTNVELVKKYGKCTEGIHRNDGSGKRNDEW